MSTSSLMTLRSLSASESWRGVKRAGRGEMGLEEKEDVEEDEEQETGPSVGFIS